MRPLLDAVVAERHLSIIATERDDGDVHPARVAPARLRARQGAVTDGRGWSMADQVHGVDVLDIDGSDAWAPTLGEADVVVTAELDTPIAIWAADCAPIVLASDDGSIVGAHGGWAGLACGVVDVAVAAASRRGGSIVHAVLGPVVHPCCYEFGSAQLATIPDGVPGRTAQGSLALDVPGTVAAALARHGVVLDVIGPCTGCDDRWFSHRARGEPGRHAVVATWSAVA